MSHTPGRRREFRLPWRTRRQVADDVEAELAFHLARKAEELVAAGVPAADAERRAEDLFGDLEFTRRYCREEDVRRERDSRHLTIMHEFKQDLVYTLRTLSAARGFALVALLTLALGIGANTAIFSVVRGVLLRPLPFPAAERVVRVWHANPTENTERSQVSEPDYLDWVASSRSFASLGGYWYAPGGSGTDLTGIGNPERIEGAYITPGFFETLGATAAIGRTIRAEEAVVGNDRYIVLSHGLWQRRFGSDRAIVGRALTVGGEPYTVLGVMPADFTFPADRLDFWMPLSTIPADGIGRQRSSRFLDVVGRLKPGVSLEQAHDELAAASRRIAEQEPEAQGFTDVTMLPVREALLGEVRRPLLVLMGAVAFVLLITCVNIASLLLARATARQREIAMRSALGAGRGRILRQLLTESVALALIGGRSGVGLAYVGVRALGAMGAAELPRASAIRIDGPVLLYALGVSTLAGLFFGLLPRCARPRTTCRACCAPGRAARGRRRPAAPQRARDRRGRARGGARGGRGAGGEELLPAARRRPGLPAANVLAVRVGMSDRYEGDLRPAYYEALLSRIAAVPGVQVVGAAKNFPLRGTGEAWARDRARRGGGRRRARGAAADAARRAPTTSARWGSRCAPGAPSRRPTRGGAPRVAGERRVRAALLAGENAVGKTLRSTSDDAR
jgi:hypothetical protein